MRLIDADALIEKAWDADTRCGYVQVVDVGDIDNAPTIEPERKTDIIQKFHDYQVEWLKSHYDIEFEPQLEEMIIRFLHDTANRYMMEEGG